MPDATWTAPDIPGSGASIDPALVRQLVVDAIRGGGGGMLPLIGMLAQSGMGGEQQAVFELLQALHEQGDEAKGQAPPDDAHRASRHASRHTSRHASPHASRHRDPSGESRDEALDESPLPGGPYVGEIADEPVAADNGDDPLHRELADLREVNDTVAAALGACGACWGGDATCPLCAGRGQAGAFMPDARLFEALVAPAVGRVIAARRRHPPARRRRDRHADGDDGHHRPPHTETAP